MRMEIKVLTWDRHKNVAGFMDKMVIVCDIVRKRKYKLPSSNQSTVYTTVFVLLDISESK
jgi:hypothetical protein